MDVTLLLVRALLSVTLLLVDAQGQTTTADLAVVTLARKLASALIDLLGTNKLVAAEALSTVLSSGDAEATVGTVVNTLGAGDLLVTNVCELEASEDASLDVVTEAALVGVARDWLWNGGSTRSKSKSGVDDSGLRDI